MGGKYFSIFEKGEEEKRTKMEKKGKQGKRGEKRGKEGKREKNRTKEGKRGEIEGE